MVRKSTIAKILEIVIAILTVVMQHLESNAEE